MNYQFPIFSLYSHPEKRHPQSIGNNILIKGYLVISSLIFAWQNRLLPFHSDLYFFLT